MVVSRLWNDRNFIRKQRSVFVFYTRKFNHLIFFTFVNQIQITQRELLSVFTIFLIGMICEILGVNYGYIFGDYVYLNNLGTKVFGVPILIGINWVILTFITGSLSSYIFKKI